MSDEWNVTEADMGDGWRLLVKDHVKEPKHVHSFKCECGEVH